MMDDEFKAEMLRQIGKMRGDLTERIGAVREDVAAVKGDVAAVGGDVAAVGGDLAAVRGDVAAVRGEVAAVASRVEAVATRLETVESHLTGRLDAVVVRLDHQDDAIAQTMDKVDRLGAWVRGSSEAAEQAINSFIELSRRVSRIEGQNPGPSRPPA